MFSYLKLSLETFSNQTFQSFSELEKAKEAVSLKLQSNADDTSHLDFLLSYLFVFKAQQLGEVEKALDKNEATLGFPQLDFGQLTKYLNQMLSFPLKEDMRSQLQTLKTYFSELSYPADYKPIQHSEFQSICSQVNKLVQDHSNDYREMLLGLKKITQQFESYCCADPYLSTKLFIGLCYYSHELISDDFYFYAGFIGYEADTRPFFLVYAQYLLNFSLCMDPNDLIFHSYFSAAMAAHNKTSPETEVIAGITMFMTQLRTFQSLSKSSYELNLRLWRRALSYFCSCRTSALSESEIWRDFESACVEFGFKSDEISSLMPEIDLSLNENYFFDLSKIIPSRK